MLFEVPLMGFTPAGRTFVVSHTDEGVLALIDTETGEEPMDGSSGAGLSAWWTRVLAGYPDDDRGAGTTYCGFRAADSDARNISATMLTREP